MDASADKMLHFIRMTALTGRNAASRSVVKVGSGPEASPLPFSETFTAKASNALGPAGFPAGPWGETPFFSERDLVVAVNQLRVLPLGGLRAA